MPHSQAGKQLFSERLWMGRLAAGASTTWYGAMKEGELRGEHNSTTSADWRLGVPVESV